MQRAILGHDANHPSIAATLNNLGSLYQKHGKLDNAETKLRDCLEMRRAIYGRIVNHPDVASTLYNPGRLLVKIEKVEDGL